MKTKPPLPSALPSTTFGRYSTISLLGEGGMGSVYLALDPVLQRNVALKVIRLDPHLDPEKKEEFLKRFQSEAKSVAKLHLQTIVSIFDAGEENGIPWIAFEFVEGESLYALLKRLKKLSPQQALTITLDIASALHHAHSREIVHRDVKPANILIDSHSGRAKLTDFGVAKAPFAMHTSDGSVVGSPGYMAPEQLDGYIADSRADIFSLGVVLYEMLSGHHPFLRDTIAATAFATIKGDQPKLSTLCEGISPEIESLVNAMLISNRKQRIQTATDCIEAFSQLLDVKPSPQSQASGSSSEGTIHDDLALFSQRFSKLANTSKTVVSYGIKGISIIIQSLGSQKVPLLRHQRAQWAATITKSMGIISTHTSSFFRELRKPWVRIAGICCALVVLFAALMQFYDYITTTVSFDDAYIAAQAPEEYAHRWPLKKLFNAGSLLIINQKFDDAKNLATTLIEAKNTEAYGNILLAWIALKKDDCSNANKLFENAQTCFGGKSRLAEVHRVIADDCIMRYTRSLIPDECVNVYASYLRCARNPMISSWVYNKDYNKRWNGVHIKIAAHAGVDMAQVYMLDVAYAASFGTRIAAINELGKLRARKAIPLLKNIASHPFRDPFVASAATRTLKDVFAISE